jgi:hypothetical protein
MLPNGSDLLIDLVTEPEHVDGALYLTAKVVFILPFVLCLFVEESDCHHFPIGIPRPN